MKQCTCYALRAIDCTCKPAKYGELYTSPTAKQDQCKPVAWRFQSSVGGWAYGKEPPIGSKYAVEPLYTTPQQRKPLTDEQLMIALLMVDPETKRLPAGFRAFARAIEAAHGIKGEA